MGPYVIIYYNPATGLVSVRKKTKRVSVIAMSTDLEEILERLENLTPEEFRVLEEKVKKGYRAPQQKNNRVPIPGTYRPTKEKVEAELKSIFTPEQLAEIARTDISNLVLPPGAKTTAELLEEDREDRL
jgi:hypothetical protein